MLLLLPPALLLLLPYRMFVADSKSKFHGKVMVSLSVDMYHATMFKVRLDTMITVVDAGAFLEAYTTGDRMVQRPDLGVDGTVM